jgi:hypothetical protein
MGLDDEDEDQEGESGAGAGRQQFSGLGVVQAARARRRGRALAIAAIRARRRVRLLAVVFARRRRRARLVAMAAIRARRRTRLLAVAALRHENAPLCSRSPPRVPGAESSCSSGRRSARACAHRPEPGRKPLSRRAAPAMGGRRFEAGSAGRESSRDRSSRWRSGRCSISGAPRKLPSLRFRYPPFHRATEKRNKPVVGGYRAPAHGLVGAPFNRACSRRPGAVAVDSVVAFAVRFRRRRLCRAPSVDEYS